MSDPIPTPNLPNIAPIGSAIPYALPQTAAGLPFTDAQVEEYREQDRWLPIANVARIMKNSLPPSAKVSKEAKECVQECCSEFISFITSEAAEKCLNEKRKTINGEDILTSMRTLGFDNYEGVLKVYLAKYREHANSQTRHKQSQAADDPHSREESEVGKRGIGELEEDSVEGGSTKKVKKIKGNNGNGTRRKKSMDNGEAGD